MLDVVGFSPQGVASGRVLLEHVILIYGTASHASLIYTSICMS